MFSVPFSLQHRAQEYLSDLCVDAFLSTEVTETLRGEGKILAPHKKEVGPWC